MKNFAIKWVMMFSLGALLICLWGFGTVLYNQFLPANHQSPLHPLPVSLPVQKHGPYHILALGDSLTHGTGDSTGKGYIGDVTARLKEKNKHPITLTNLAVKGATSADLLKQMNQPEVKRQIRQATVIIFTIGGNDLFNGGQNLVHFSGKTIHQDETLYLNHLKCIYQEMRHLNQTAAIYHIGLYNPFNDLKNGAATSAVVRKWNADSANVAANYNNVVEVPIYDLFQRHVKKFLSSDDFHPDQLGYQRIANRLAPLITFARNGGS